MIKVCYCSNNGGDYSNQGPVPTKLNLCLIIKNRSIRLCGDPYAAVDQLCHWHWSLLPKHGDKFEASYSNFSMKQIFSFLDRLQDRYFQIHFRSHSYTTMQTFSYVHGQKLMLSTIFLP